MANRDDDVPQAVHHQSGEALRKGELTELRHRRNRDVALVRHRRLLRAIANEAHACDRRAVVPPRRPAEGGVHDESKVARVDEGRAAFRSQLVHYGLPFVARAAKTLREGPRSAE